MAIKIASQRKKMSHTNAADTGVSAAVSGYDALARSLRKKVFSDDSESASFPDLGIDAFKLLFHSHNAGHLVGAGEYRCSEHGITFNDEPVEETGDAAIAQNNVFRYPLIREARSGGGLKRHHHAIILLHGLNEGSFSKYVPWACDLCRAAGTPVLMFPMAFHMNRVLPAWASQQLATAQRRGGLDGNDCAHRFNAVISERLNHRPERFFWGAVQTYLDLVDLAREIRSGRHAHFTEAARIDVIGYSAGGYLALFLLLDNRDDLFADSRGVVFASGVPFRDLDLASPLILDLTAEVALMKLFVKNFDPPHSARVQHWIESHREGRLMRLFCGQRAQRTALEAKLREIAPRLLGITNVNDEVIPVGSMLNTLQGVKRDTGVPVREFELGVHENPFSVPSYQKEAPSRKLITESIAPETYGSAFDRFIATVAEHFSD
jgi:pimeloyl-ACP methyl ester carboxylesterase